MRPTLAALGDLIHYDYDYRSDQTLSIPRLSLRTGRVPETLITVPKERDMTKNNTVYETITTLAPSASSQSKTMRYYDLKKNWRQKYRRVGAPESVDAGDESR